MSNIQVKWQWLNSKKISNVCAALAFGDIRLVLTNYLLHNVDIDIYKQLKIVLHDEVIVLIGDKELLPWIDGIQYAGYDDIEPRLWRPAHRVPSVDISLLADSLCNRYEQEPLLVWDNPKAIISINKAQIVNLFLLNTIAAQYEKSL
ncbi:hypothetical protein RHO13_02060 [Orbus wheelerorum]|uniref:bpX5 domain-containing protein n=1 Tax=Orbus wheelerorum TaxID=3074111 RepID=UPI00370D6908